MTLKVRILQLWTTFTQLITRLKNFLRGWLLVLDLKEGLVECATVCVKSEVILDLSWVDKKGSATRSTTPSKTVWTWVLKCFIYQGIPPTRAATGTNSETMNHDFFPQNLFLSDQTFFICEKTSFNLTRYCQFFGPWLSIIFSSQTESSDIIYFLILDFFTHFCAQNLLWPGQQHKQQILWKFKVHSSGIGWWIPGTI